MRAGILPRDSRDSHAKCVKKTSILCVNHASVKRRATLFVTLKEFVIIKSV